MIPFRDPDPDTTRKLMAFEPKFKVMFKNELDADDPVGPVTVIDVEKYESDPEVKKSTFGIPYGYKPNGVAELGWKPRSEALAIAAAHGVELTEG